MTRADDAGAVSFGLNTGGLPWGSPDAAWVNYGRGGGGNGATVGYRTSTAGDFFPGAYDFIYQLDRTYRNTIVYNGWDQSLRWTVRDISGGASFTYSSGPGRGSFAAIDRLLVENDNLGGGTAEGYLDNVELSVAPELDCRIVYHDQAQSPSRIHWFDTVGGSAHPVPLSTTFQNSAQPEWSPDGKWITFVARADGVSGQAIWQVRPDGGDLGSIVTGGDYNSPSYSPDGNRLAYSSASSQKYIFEFNAATPDLHDGTATPHGGGTHTQWMPDNLIAYSSWDGSNGDIFVYDPATQTNEQVTFAKPAEEAFQFAAWSPDGGKLVVSRVDRHHSDTYDLWLYERTGAGEWSFVRDLTPDSASTSEKLASWTPDGEYILFSSNRSGSYDIWAVTPDGTYLHQVTDTPGIDEMDISITAPLDATSSWIGNLGTWSDANNWDTTPGPDLVGFPKRVPDNGDGYRYDVSIGSGAISVDSDVTIQKLNLANATVTIAPGMTLSLHKPGSTIADATIGGAGMLKINTAGIFTGRGHISANVDNTGIIQAKSGSLLFSGNSFSNSGLLANATGASVYVDSPIVGNTGNVVVNPGYIIFDAPIGIRFNKSLALRGGTLGTPTLTNNGSLNGFGQLAGNLDNFASVDFYGSSAIIGNVNNEAGGFLKVRNDQVLIHGSLTNSGTIVAENGGRLIVEGGISGGASSAEPAAAGAVVIQPGTTLISKHVQQETLQLNGLSGNPGVVMINHRSSGGGVSVLRNFTIEAAGGAWLGRLDLNDNELILSASSVTTVTSQLRSALFNGGSFDWRGPGIGSTRAAEQSQTAGSFLYGLGVVLNDLAQVGGSGPIYTSFGGVPVAGGEVLVRYTTFGDADLSGAIDATDYSLIDNGYVNSLSGWINGDFDYSGVIDATDYALIDNAYVNQSGALVDAIIAEHTRMFGGEYLAALRAVQSGVIPEPVAVSLMAMGAWSLKRPRRRLP
ncbi:DPP IV N-terminal domain-containing protein [Fontivita pretiosa]|uniref:DPP IV N-terminal domain-containing protein n=1 Tax=Fontivita pretiosa TaxID=2989684 RepID=UPI003D17B3B3